MSTIYDSVTPAAIPAGATIILAYIDGAWQTYNEVRDHFPQATILTVTTNGLNPADICDVESGDATPQIAAEWVAAGHGDTVYCATSNHDAVAAAMGDRPWQYFAADWTGVPHLVPGSVATQWGTAGLGASGNYDISLTAGDYPFAPTPTPPPVLPPTTVPEDLFDMLASDPGFAVRYLYRFALHREVDPGGFTANVNYLNAGGTLNQVLANLQDSAEGQAVIAAERKAMGL